MGKSTILLVDELAQGQVQAFTTVNNALAAHEQSNNAPLIIDATGETEMVVAELDMVRYRVFRVEGHAAELDLVFPAEMNVIDGPILDSLRVVWIYNEENFPIVVQTDDPGSTVFIPPLGSCEVLIDSVNVIGLTKAKNAPFTIGGYIGGIPTPNIEVLRYVFADYVTIPNEFSGSLGSIGSNPDSQVIVEVYKNDVRFGQIAISSAGAFTFTTDAAAVDFVPGDVLTAFYRSVEFGEVAFGAVADNGDTITFDDGLNTPVVFSFVTSGATGDQVNIGVNATASAQNLLAKINARASLDITASGAGATLAIRNDNLLGGGAITKSDADNDYVITDFLADAVAESIAFTIVATRK